MIEFSPTPSSEEAAAILAAYDLLWPRTAVVEPPQQPSRWRFAGRRWSGCAGYGGWA